MLAHRPKNPITLAADATENVVQIRYGAELFRLREPIDLQVRSGRGRYVVAYPPLEIEGYGDDDREALDSFADQFGSTWHSIALEDDARLTRDARVIKKRMLKLVARVE
ncbi:MAG: hypothetical protein LAQ69_36225 [Acidobacteriia bacterium]|nr:hypothetical protein [Terriglobia bacterium]